MNYIKQLQTKVENNERQMLDAQEMIQDFRAFLFSAKFTGTDSDGERKDWIATADVAARLQEICSVLRIER